MKWKPPSERAMFWIVSPITFPIMAAATPIVLCMAAVLVPANWLMNKFQPSWEWTRWYAWRPVRINDWFDPSEGKWAWLEHVERRTNRGEIEVRTLEFADQSIGGK